MNEALTWVDEECEEKFGEKLYHREGGNFYLDRDRLKKANIELDQIYNIVEKYLSNVEGIDGVAIKDKIMASFEEDKITQRIKNMINHIEPGWLVQRVGGMGCARTLIGQTHLPEVNALCKGLCASHTKGL